MICFQKREAELARAASEFRVPRFGFQGSDDGPPAVLESVRAERGAEEQVRCANPPGDAFEDEIDILHFASFLGEEFARDVTEECTKPPPKGELSLFPSFAFSESPPSPCFAEQEEDWWNRTGPLSPEERRQKVQRYLEKKATRWKRSRSRYQRRKTVAEGRVREGGRFVSKKRERELASSSLKRHTGDKTPAKRQRKK